VLLDDREGALRAHPVNFFCHLPRMPGRQALRLSP
jgi:hypothetical protein